MTLLPPNVKVHLALGCVDMRNYAERTIMQSARSTELRPALFSTGWRRERGWKWVWRDLR